MANNFPELYVSGLVKAFQNHFGEAHDIHVDGSPGKKTANRAGWGLCVTRGDRMVLRACGYMNGRLTNNEAELLALSRGMSLALSLAFIKRITIYSDSKYAVNSMIWLPKMKAAGWRLSGGGPAKNADWLRKMHALFYGSGMHRRVLVRYEPGHSGLEANELADKLSKSAAAKGEEFCQFHQ